MQLKENGGTAQLKRLLSSWWVIVIVLGILASVFFFIGLDSYPMQNWDEGVHSQVTREMVDTGDYWTLQYQGEHYFRKPPLKMWLTAPLVSIFGNHNWVHRFWNALAGVLSVLLLARFIFEKEKKPLMVWVASFIFISGQYIFYHSFRTGEMDGLLLLFLIVGFYAYWKGQTKSTWLLVMGISFGLAVMTKSLAGLVGPIVVVLDSIITKQWHLFKTKNLWWAVGAFFVVTIPWHASQIFLWGRSFWDMYIGFHIVDRTFVQLYADLPTWWYAKIIYGRLFPLSFLLLGGSLLLLRDLFKEKKKDLVVLMLWVLVPFLLYTWIKTKFEWYMLPLYPPLAWILARYIYSLCKQHKDWLLLSTAAISAFLTFSFIPRAVVPGAKTYWFTLQAYTPKTFLSAMDNPYILSGIFMAVLIALALFLYKKKPIVVKCLVILFVVYSLGFAFGRNIGMLWTLPTQSVFEQVQEGVKMENPEKILLYETDIFGKPAGYYEIAELGIPIEQITDKRDTLELHPGELVITETDMSQNANLRLVEQFERYSIYVNN